METASRSSCKLLRDTICQLSTQSVAASVALQRARRPSEKNAGIIYSIVLRLATQTLGERVGCHSSCLLVLDINSIPRNVGSLAMHTVNQLHENSRHPVFAI